MSSAEKGTVYLVGAGPGDPELLTVRAAALLRTADLVLHDDLVTPAVLALAASRSLVLNVGKRCGVKHVLQSEINAVMVEAAGRGLAVVRLKSGDPLVFGRAAEEMDALRAAAVPFHIVPGITAAFAAAAQIGCSLTDRRTASSVEFSTGHRASEDDTDEAPTRVIYMPGRSFRALANERLRGGDAFDLPCCIISRAAQPDQQITWTTLGALGDAEPGPAPVLLLVGRALAAAAKRAEKASAEYAPTPAAIAAGPRELPVIAP